MCAIVMSLFKEGWETGARHPAGTAPPSTLQTSTRRIFALLLLISAKHIHII